MDKNFRWFLNNFFSKKYFFTLFLIVGFVGIGFPLRSADAFMDIGLKSFISDVVFNSDTYVDLILGLIYLLGFNFFNVILNLSIILVHFGAWLIDAAVNPVLYVGDSFSGIKGVLNSSSVQAGWKTVRDMCYTFYLFFLVIIAFGTILRSNTFNAKNLVPKLVVSLLLINFSSVIAGIVIDFGQVFMYGIMNWMGGGGSFQNGASTLSSVAERFNNEINFTGISYSFNDVVRVSFAAIYSIILGLVYIMLAMFLFVRLIAFIILIILSPLAFFSIVMPSMGKYSSRWWSEIIKYSLFGPVFMFFVYLSTTIANELVVNDYQSVITGLPADTSFITSIAFIMLPHMVALFMLLAVIPITQELGMAGSNKIIGGTAGIGKIAMGTYAGIKLAGGLGRRAGSEVSSRSDTISSKIDGAKKRYYEGMAVIPGLKGTALKGKAKFEKRKEDRMKKLEMEFGDLKSIELKMLESKANGKLGTTDDKALLLKAAAAQGKLGDEKYKDYLIGAEASLSKNELKEITNKSLTLATMTKESQNRIKNKDKDSFDNKEARERIQKRLDLNEDPETIYTEEIMREKMNSLIEDGEAHKVQGLNDAMAARIWHESQDSEQRKSSINRMTKDDREKLVEGYMGNTIGFDKTEDIDAERDYNSASDAQKEKDAEMRTNAAKIGGHLEKSFTVGGRVLGDQIGKAFSEFDTKQVIRFSNEDLEKYGQYANSSQLRNLNRAGEEKKIKVIEKSKKERLDRINVTMMLPGVHPGLEEEKRGIEKDLDNIKSMMEGNKF